jgi:hypothetical protein
MCPALDRLFRRFGDEPALQALNRRRQGGGQDAAIHREALDWLETALWRLGPDDTLLALQQALYREWEQHLPEDAPRHDFMVVIPVADRPRHLEQCLGSLLELCRCYGYGGLRDGRYRRVSVLIADDSAGPENRQRHREIAARFSDRGLVCEYFGPEEQLELLGALPEPRRRALSAVIGSHDRAAFHHKGASATRNIAYLRLRQIAGEGGRWLFHFVDSDQEFRVRARAPDGERDLYAINYFYWLDRLFSENDIAVLTGKVVGDPPVSPAVMAGNFLEDVLAFLTDLAEQAPAQACGFHGAPDRGSGDAAYHDMADLFGFQPAADAHAYRCRLAGEHDNAACLAGFAERVNRFFDGEHLTRSDLFDPREGPGEARAARTVYTGNYCINAEGLDFFIPFAALRLRMAGPVLGRLIRAALGPRFVSANLPMLHRRTVSAIGQSEFRPGIRRDTDLVDLSGEFERQFFGDLMLFTMESLTDRGYPEQAPGRAQVERALLEVEARLLTMYRRKQARILNKLVLCRSFFAMPGHWWHRTPEGLPIGPEFQRFFRAMEHNFGTDAAGFLAVQSPAHREVRRRELLDAILAYGDDRAAWRASMEPA